MGGRDAALAALRAAPRLLVWIYLYGFMVQQCVANIAPQLSHVTAVLIAAPFILLCAALSWHSWRGRC